MIRFSKNEMKKASSQLREGIKENKGYLSSITMTDMSSKKHKVSKKEYMGLFEAQNIFIRKHGRYPNYVTLNSTANNPLVMDYQDNAYTCGPTSLSMAIQMLFDYVSEKECAKAVNTIIGSGTSPSDMMSGAKKLGYSLKKISRNKSSVKAQLSMGKPVIAHIDTKPATCLGYKNNYGHYVLIYGANSTDYFVADPTKGLKRCKFSVLDKAQLGRSINYYGVGIL